jgi:hypothetical protein
MNEYKPTSVEVLEREFQLFKPIEHIIAVASIAEIIQYKAQFKRESKLPPTLPAPSEYLTHALLNDVFVFHFRVPFYHPLAANLRATIKRYPSSWFKDINNATAFYNAYLDFLTEIESITKKSTGVDLYVHRALDPLPSPLPTPTSKEGNPSAG